MAGLQKSELICLYTHYESNIQSYMYTKWTLEIWECSLEYYMYIAYRHSVRYIQIHVKLILVCIHVHVYKWRLWFSAGSRVMELGGSLKTSLKENNFRRRFNKAKVLKTTRASSLKTSGQNIDESCFLLSWSFPLVTCTCIYLCFHLYKGGIETVSNEQWFVFLYVSP